MENLLTGYPNLQNKGSEDKIYIYIVKNMTQPLEIIIENSAIKELSQDAASCSINTNIDQNNCLTQCEKFSNENMRMPRDTTCREGETPFIHYNCCRNYYRNNNYKQQLLQKLQQLTM